MWPVAGQAAPFAQNLVLWAALTANLRAGAGEVRVGHGGTRVCWVRIAEEARGERFSN